MTGVIYFVLSLAAKRLLLAKSACSSLLSPFGLADHFKPVLTDQLQAQSYVPAGFANIRIVEEERNLSNAPLRGILWFELNPYQTSEMSQQRQFLRLL